MPQWALLLLLLLPTAFTLSYKCENNQVLVVQSFGNDTIRMHCQRLDLCGYQQLKCEYDKMQPHCGGKTNFVAHVNQNTPTGLVEHTCCQLYNPNPPNHVPTHDGNDCFIYELPDGSTHPEGEVLQPLTPLNAEDKPLTILKSAAEIPSQIDGYSGYRLRLFLLRNKSPPTLLVKGIERRIDGYRVTICRPRCGSPPVTGNGWRGVSWNSWSSSSWSSWAKTVWGNAEHEEAEKRERVRQREGQITGNNASATASASAAAAAAAAANAGGNNGNAGLSGETGKSGASGSAAASGSASSGSSSATGQGAQAASSASTAAKAESGNSNLNGNGGNSGNNGNNGNNEKNGNDGTGQINIHIHTDGEDKEKNNGAGGGNGEGPLIKGFETGNNSNSGKTGNENGSETKSETSKPITATSESFNANGSNGKTTSGGLSGVTPKPSGESGEPTGPIDPTTPNGKETTKEQENKQTENGSTGKPTDSKSTTSKEKNDEEKNKNGSNGETKPTIGIDGGEGTETEPNNGKRPRIIEGRQGPGEDETEKSKENNGQGKGGDEDDGVTENGQTGPGNQNGKKTEKSAEVHGRTETKDFSTEVTETKADERENDENEVIETSEGDGDEIDGDDDGEEEEGDGDGGDEGHVGEPMHPDEDGSSETDINNIIGKKHKEPLNENDAKDDIIEKKKKRLAKAKARAKAKKEAAKRRRKLQAARQEAQRRHNKGQFRTIAATAEKESSPALAAAPRLLADPPAAAAGRNCFAADSIVSTSRGPRRMDELQVGDRVLVPSANGVPKFELIEMFYHRIPDRRTNFVILETASGHKLSVTPLHLLPFGDCIEMEKLLNQSEGIDSALHGSRFVHRARVGDCLLTTNGDGVIKTEEIIKIGRRISTGIYSPITVEGAIIVDGVLASCFAQVESHATHKVLYDFTHWVYKAFSITTTSSEWSEVFPLPRLVHYMHELSRHVLPFSKY